MRDDALVDTLGELRARLAGFRLGAGRDLRALAAAIEGERVEAVVVGLWGRRAWLIAATDAGLRLVRRPWLGRHRDAAWPWEALTDVRAGTQRVDLAFGGDRVELRFLGPHDEFMRLLETARRALGGGEPGTTTAELRRLARAKLGRTLAFGFEAALDALPDRLRPGERVQRLAVARLDFTGLLAVTDARVLLFEVGLTRGGERLWAVEREQITGAEAVDGDLRLLLADGPVTLAGVQPPERSAELAAVLWRG